jgi:tetratricopeptide (TPR) repeat protein
MQYHELVFSAGATEVLKNAYGKLLHKINLGKTLDPAYLAALTQRMRELLYAQEALTTFWQTVEATPDNTYHLHLMHRDKELLNLPWQMAIDDYKHPAVYISKGSTAAQPPVAYTPQAGPLKILVMISSPADEHVSKRLSYEQEEEALLEAVRPLYEKQQVQVSFTITGSLQSLEAMLAKEHFHLLYFSGHGTYKHQTGSLVLEDENTLEGIVVTANEFAAAVCKYRPHIPALVILASCQSAEGNVEEGFPGVADELMAAGVPAVIAMAFSIPDRYITVFVAHLFEALGRQEALLTAYVQALHELETAEANYAIEEDYDLSPTQWLVPQLYCSKPVEHIVQWAGSKTTKQKKHTPATVGSTSAYRFIGRRHELSRLLPLLHIGKPVLLVGQAGVGKTALAEKAVQRLLAADSRQVQFRFESGKINMEAIKTCLSPFLSTHDVAHTGGEASKTTGAENLLEAVRKVCRPLWVVDDMDAMQSYAGGPLRDEHKAWLNWLQQHVIAYDPVLFISRYAVPELSEVQTLAINEGSPADLYIHLQQLGAGELISAQPDANRLQITEIIYNALGGHYGAWACFDRLYTRQANTLVKTIEKIYFTKDPSKTLHLYDKITAIVQEEINKEGWSANLNSLGDFLENADWQALQLLAHFRIPVSVRALEMQETEIVWQPVLAKLQGLALVEKQEVAVDDSEELFYYVTRLVKVWLPQQKDLEGSFSAKLAGDYYYIRGKESDELADFVEAFWHYLPEQQVELINETGQIIARAYYDAGKYEDTLTYALHTLQTCGEDTYPEILNIIGAVYKQLGNFEETIKFWMAFLEAAIHIGNRVQEGLALNNLSALLHELGGTEDAQTMMETSIAISRETKDLEQVAFQLNSLGKIVETQHDHTRARALYEESLQLHKEMENRSGEAITLLNLADAYAHAGELEKAQQSLQFCITVFKEEGDMDLEAMAYEKLGELYEENGEHEQALDFLNESLQLYHSLRKRLGQSRVLDLIGQLYTAMGYYDHADVYLTKSLALAQQIGLKQAEAATLLHLSDLFRNKGEPDKGIPYVKMALPIYREQEDKSGEADSLFQLGRLYFDKGNTEMGSRYFKQSKKLLDAIGPAARQDILDVIEHQLLPPEDTAKRLSILEKQLTECRKKGNKLYQAEILFQMADWALDMEDQDDNFFDWADEAYDIYTDLDYRPGIYRTGCMLGEVLYFSEDAEDRAEGLELLQYCFQIGQAEGYPDTQEIAAIIRGEGS